MCQKSHYRLDSPSLPPWGYPSPLFWALWGCFTPFCHYPHLRWLSLTLFAVTHRFSTRSQIPMRNEWKFMCYQDGGSIKLQFTLLLCPALLGWRFVSLSCCCIVSRAVDRISHLLMYVFLWGLLILCWWVLLLLCLHLQCLSHLFW